MRSPVIVLLLALLVPLLVSVPVQGQSCQVTVTLLSIDILDDGDPFPLGEGEIFAETATDVAVIGPVSVRVPPAGTVSRGDGETWFINAVIFDGSALQSQFPTTMHLIIQVWDEDVPGPNDPLGRVDEVFGLVCPSDATFSRLSTQDGQSRIHFRIHVTGGGGGGGTDWAVLSVGLNPTSPHVGDSVTFRMIMTALSTAGSFPQSVAVQCQVDGASCGAGSVTFPGPTGTPFTVTTSTPWTATLGSHTLTWLVSTSGDPNSSNNVMSTSFMVQPAESPFDFTLEISPAERSASPGGSTTYAVNTNLVGGCCAVVTLSLSGAPSGVTGVFDPSSGTPPFSSTLRVSVSSAVSPGSYSMVVSGTGGGRTHTSSINLIVSQAADFRIEANPPSQTVNQGQTASYSVNVVDMNGFASAVSLSVSGLPAGANGVFSTPSGTPSFSSTLTVTPPGNVQTGSFTLTIMGSGGGVTRTANVVLVIAAAPQTQTTTSETSPGQGGIMEMLQGNSLLLIGALALLVIILLAALALRRRGPKYPPPPPPPTRACPKCGQPLMYVPQYDRWYCNNCKEYR